MKKVFFCMIALVIMLASCRSNTSSTATNQEVDFQVANGYFFRNDKAVPERPIVITSQQVLEEYFGYAATMSAKPTQIDFTKQAALAIVMQPTNVNTEIAVNSIVEHQNDTLLMNYSLSTGDSISYTIQPMAIVVISKENLLPNVEAKEAKAE